VQRGANKKVLSRKRKKEKEIKKKYICMRKREKCEYV
jgi:hypothetical protein